ncbi:MAG: hypothetical protein KDK91_12315 [Gammaproteobacteria bacterium]|nr:hypothetical protein [Gammaproteobacteria bacterium]
MSIGIDPPTYRRIAAVARQTLRTKASVILDAIDYQLPLDEAHIEAARSAAALALRMVGTAGQPDMPGGKPPASAESRASVPRSKRAVQAGGGATLKPRIH